MGGELGKTSFKSLSFAIDSAPEELCAGSSRGVVYVLAAGIRKEGDKKDIYKIAKKLLDAGLMD